MPKVKVCDYIAEFLVQKNADLIFAISGASNLRILDAIHRHPRLRYVCPHHEQAGVMAATTYYRLSGKPGLMLVTAGPGATNTITGVANAFLDSIPIMILAGQEKSEYLAPNYPVRCKGVQGLNMVEVVRPLTKYAVCVRDAKEIRYHLERAYFEAYHGKPGPVWLEVTQDVQSIDIDPHELKTFTPPETPKVDYESAAKTLIEMIRKSERPLLWVGHGIRLSQSVETFRTLLDRLQIPSLASWQAADLIEETHPYYAGRAGTYGQRAGNFAVQNCDLLICLGTRLAIPQMGYVEKEFARAAKKVVVEIDPAEISKFKQPPDLVVQGDVGAFMKALLTQMPKANSWNFSNWTHRCIEWRRKYPPCLPAFKDTPKGEVNSYYFIDRLSEQLTAEDVICTDMGTSLTCTHATIRLKWGQRLVTSTGLGEMGFGLPGAIGACFGVNKRKTIFIGVEGSLQMNLQELQTVIHHQLPLKIFILNNNSYLTIKHTERALFGERLSGSSPETGVSFPNLEKISKAYGFTYFKIDDSLRVEDEIRSALSTQGPVFVEVVMPKDQFLGPKSGIKRKEDGSIYSPPLEDLFPFLPREELKANMIVPLLSEDRS